jgi:hypothetical protein
MGGKIIRYAAIGTLVLVFAVECILRWAVGLGDPPLARLDPVTEYELVPSASYKRWGNQVTINADGMRGPEHPALPDVQERHVLLIGDSVVYGGHFLDQSETISAQMLQVFSDDTRLAGCTVRVLPMAASSWGPVNQAAFLEEYGTFGATAAGIVVSAHDLYDTPNAVSDILPYRTAPAFTAIGDAVQAVLERTQRAAPEAEDTLPFEARAQTSLAALDQIADLLDEQNVRPVLIYHPTVTERSGQVDPAQTTFAQWAQTRGIRLLDFGSTQVAPTDYRDDIHPTASGANLLARTVAPVIAEGLQPC